MVILNFSGTKQKYQLPERLVMKFWARSTYTKGRANKAVGGSIYTPAVGGSVGKVQNLMAAYHLKRAIIPHKASICHTPTALRSPNRRYYHHRTTLIARLRHARIYYAMGL